MKILGVSPEIIHLHASRTFFEISASNVYRVNAEQAYYDACQSFVEVSDFQC